jgi:hypothetical protein
MKVFKNIALVLLILVGLVLASIPVMNWLAEYEWQMFAKEKHCTLIAGDQYKCDSGTVRKPSGPR